MSLMDECGQVDGRLLPLTAGTNAAKVMDVPGAVVSLQRYPALQYPRDKLLRATRQPQPSTGQMVAAIESDVVLTVHVLRAANEKTGGLRRQSQAVLGVPRAVQELGAANLAGIARDAPHVGFFAHNDVINPEGFRVHALATRKAAETIMHVNRPSVPADHVYAVAILHDIGKLVMALTQKHSGDTAAAPAAHFAQERRSLSLDHATAGALLAIRWGLPESFATAIANHHNPGAGAVSDIICLADLLAHHAQGTELAADELAAACRPLHLPLGQVGALVYEVSGGLSTRTIPEECPLSPRQLSALQALAQGKAYKEIAAELGVSASTVRSHLHGVYQKLGVCDRAQAVLLSARRGWI